MTAWAFFAIGRPAPQGNKHHVGHGILVENPSLKPWRDTVTAAAFGAGKQLSGPLCVRMVFTMPRPKSAPKRLYAPSGRPDASKLARAAEDSITDAGLWADDAQVVDYVRLAKVWTGHDADALPVPGVLVAASELDEDHPYDALTVAFSQAHAAAWATWKAEVTA